ncbi:DMT family transporter [Chroococcidiopsis sp. FACHB-1243]|uniref:DMT family transporter n=1 Tax=Chroococcidiopsis sp. [FACHB-1243] TaxID=2692781 RepID=UPI001781A62B|nr:DMT family transporter [Chroococcidiopsis sp. [FACHB-1243]]MBD2308363.1 DMT family transporter [Chroococcidiopsis sp. [FACHB-1243]]
MPRQLYLWLAISIFGASSSVTRRLTQLGSMHLVDGRNPISLCNVLFVGNLCALLVLAIVYRQQLTLTRLQQLSRREWVGAIAVAILAGAIAPSFIFAALSLTTVNNVVLVGRLEPPLVLALSIWLLHERVNSWEIIGAIVSFTGVVLSIVLQPPQPGMIMAGFRVGAGEILTALGAIALAVSTIVSKSWLSQLPLGLYSTIRTALGTVVFFVFALLLYGKHHFIDAFSPFLWQWMLVYGTVIVVLGQAFWIQGLRTSTVPEVSLASSFTPIAGILSAYLILGEIPTLAQYIGGSIVLLGICLSQIGSWRKGLSEIKVRSTQTAREIEDRIGFKGM